MYLEIIILSVLRHGPIHGYELKQRVRSVTLNELSNNSLYPMLRRFEQNDLATKTVEAQEGKPSRNVYEITEQGRTHFQAMVSTLPIELASNDDEFLIRVGFFGEIGAGDRVAILRVRDAVLADRAQALLALETMPSRSADRRWRDETTAWYVSRVEAERSWIAGLMSKAGV